MYASIKVQPHGGVSADYSDGISLVFEDKQTMSAMVRVMLPTNFPKDKLQEAINALRDGLEQSRLGHEDKRAAVLG
jgi:hypothetical protein